MNNIANEQLFELGVLLIAAFVYIVAHFTCSGLAILISNQKTGIIRSFLQGMLLVGILAIAVICFFNGKIKFYHFIAYGGTVAMLIKIINLFKNKIHQIKAYKKEIKN